LLQYCCVNQLDLLSMGQFNSLKGDGSAALTGLC